MGVVTTKTGDKGTTGTFDGRRVSKGALEVEVLGSLDELFSFIGVAKSFSKNEEIKNKLDEIQRDIQIVLGKYCYIKDNEEQIIGIKNKYEKWIEQYNYLYKDLNGFVISGVNQSESFIFLSRSVCRRVERLVVRRMEAEPEYNSVQVFLNRLSDLLFILSLFERKNPNS